MKLTIHQFEALAYIFEGEHGNAKTVYENEIIAESGLSKYEPKLLEKEVVDGLNSGLYANSTDRISAYWALGKRFNEELIPFFQKWLRIELELNDAQAVYQLLISLSNMEEPVFNPDRDGGSAASETELNLRDAAKYLNTAIQ